MKQPLPVLIAEDNPANPRSWRNAVKQPLRVLIAEDNPADAELILHELRRAGYDPEWERVDTEAEYLDRLHPDLDIILSDHDMPGFGGLRALELLQERGLDVPFIIISGTIGEEIAVAVMKLGAADYLLKDRLTRLGPAVSHAIEQARLRQEAARAEKDLRESEERFRQLAENIDEVFWLTDPTKNLILYVSPAYETIWGRSSAGVYASALSWLDSIHPEDRESIRHAAVTKQSEGTYDEEYRIVRPDGSIRWIRDRAFPVRDSGGEIYRIVGVARDITDRKLSDKAIRVSEQRFSSFMDNVPGFAWMKDGEGRYVYGNKLFQDFLQPGQEWRGRTADEVWPPEIAAPLLEHDHKVIETEAPVQIVEMVVQSGEKRAVLSSKFPILNGNGEVAFIGGIGIDITERRRAEQRVCEQAKLLDLAQDAIMVRDMQDRVEFWNHGAEKLYGWTAAEVQGKKACRLFYEDQPSSVAAARAAVMEHGKWTGECKHACKGGGTVIVRSRWTLVRDESAAPKSILIINTDITERKKIEEQFLRAQRLESIGTLASGVAHDLNNILVPILMAAPLLRDDMPAEEREKLLAIVQSSAERGASIVKQVLTFARGADGDRVLLQPIYLVQEIAKIVGETFPKSVAVHTNYPEDLWTIVADPTQLHQILLNLCINARDAMPGGGTLTLALENFEVDEQYASMTAGAKAGPHVLLKVSDTGTGIPREIIDKIFDPFFTTKELGQGTGLGLSTAIGIVKSHGGFMQVYSEVGRGTSFKVFLPANVTEGADAPTFETTPLPRANGELLLIVDDEKSILQVAGSIMEDHGYRVLIAADAPEALAIFALRMNEIELVLTDLAMPFMDGVALIRTLQKMKPDVRVIASTGLGGQDGRANEIAHLNVRANLTKPYNKTKLLATLHDVLIQPSDNHSSSGAQLETNNL